MSVLRSSSSTQTFISELTQRLARMITSWVVQPLHKLSHLSITLHIWHEL